MSNNPKLYCVDQHFLFINKKHVLACELPGSLHWLRNTYCTYNVLAETPLRGIQMLAGHSTVAVSEKYTHVISELNQFAGNISV